MKNILLLFIVLISISACKKGAGGKNEDVVGPGKVILNQPEVIDGVSVKLTWSQTDAADFVSYIVYREVEVDGGKSYGPIKQINDKTQTSYIDNELPYRAKIRYYIVVAFDTQAVRSVKSNTVEFSRVIAGVMPIMPLDVLFDKDNGLLYLIEEGGNVSLYDITKSQITKTINTAATLGYSALAIYNGKKELYVPRNDGWVFVYDAVTLDKVAQINSGVNGTSVVCQKGLLFVSASNYGQWQPLKVIDRATGLKVADAAAQDIRRIKYIPNSDIELLVLESPSYERVYRFEGTGKFLGKVYSPTVTGAYYHDVKLMEFFPDGSKYIASFQGDIVNKDMVPNTRLPINNVTFTTFLINNDLIYGGTTSNTITSFNSVGYARQKTYITSGVPLKVFDLGTQLLCVSKVTNINPVVSGIAIEKLNK